MPPSPRSGASCREREKAHRSPHALVRFLPSLPTRCWTQSAEIAQHRAGDGQVPPLCLTGWKVAVAINSSGCWAYRLEAAASPARRVSHQPLPTMSCVPYPALATANIGFQKGGAKSLRRQPEVKPGAKQGKQARRNWKESKAPRCSRGLRATCAIGEALRSARTRRDSERLRGWPGLDRAPSEKCVGRHPANGPFASN